ncbi:hypothetical protein GCM10011344_42750 [Dokdonia pacifica]|uniref:Uncharacterized protein n=1 Tax=Dokdonia pacifica TaxID=1627892 RepID=A0A239AHZ8_9FLAO|nr:hypothetical protein [Dokdonia pacifica]GGG37376.1 hypothetical protein GCM10011344_42750 [Dokdonia pacifica]SNR95149.1 hypothetical protein SAMN06265376_104449 [Dokdonia pacifica]
MKSLNRITDPDIEYKILLNNFWAFSRKYGLIRGIIFWVLNTLLRSIAFPALVMLRYGFGRASMGISVLGVSFLYCNYFVLNQISLKPLSSYSNPHELPEQLASIYWSSFQIFHNLKMIIKSISWDWQHNEVISISSFYFSFVVLALGIFNLLYEQLVPETKKPHVRHRGTSFLFSNIINKSNKIDKTIFLRFLEPLILFLIGIGLIYFDIETNFGWLISISSTALFFEEQRSFSMDRKFHDVTRR